MENKRFLNHPQSSTEDKEESKKESSLIEQLKQANEEEKPLTFRLKLIVDNYKKSNENK